MKWDKKALAARGNIRGNTPSGRDLAELGGCRHDGKLGDGTEGADQRMVEVHYTSGCAMCQPAL